MRFECWDCYIARAMTDLTHCLKHGADEEKAANRRRAVEAIERLGRHPFMRLVPK